MTDATSLQDVLTQIAGTDGDEASSRPYTDLTVERLPVEESAFTTKPIAMAAFTTGCVRVKGVRVYDSGERGLLLDFPTRIIADQRREAVTLDRATRDLLREDVAAALAESEAQA